MFLSVSTYVYMYILLSHLKINCRYHVTSPLNSFMDTMWSVYPHLPLIFLGFLNVLFIFWEEGGGQRIPSGFHADRLIASSPCGSRTHKTWDHDHEPKSDAQPTEPARCPIVLVFKLNALCLENPTQDSRSSSVTHNDDILLHNHKTIIKPKKIDRNSISSSFHSTFEFIHLSL